MQEVCCEVRQAGEVFGHTTGYEPAYPASSPVLIGQLLHLVGVLVDRHQLVDVHEMLFIIRESKAVYLQLPSVAF